MIVFLDGCVASTGLGFVDLDVNHVGYRVYLTDAALKTCTLGAQVRVYTYQHVREDAISLFGFLNQGERAVFERLLSVSGIGPRVAMQMIGALPADILVSAIRSEDAGTLCSLPGVGKKTAQRIILDLKDKLDDLPFELSFSTQTMTAAPAAEVALANDVSDALVALGYRGREASQAIEAVLAKEPNITVELAVKACLKWLYEHQSEMAAKP